VVDPLTAAGGPARRRLLVTLLRLRSVPGLGRARAARWVKAAGGAAGALVRATREVGAPELDVAGAELALDRMLADCARCGVSVVLRDDPEYPSAFGDLADPPVMLFLRGHATPPDATSVAVVGSRRATEYGRRVAQDLGRGLGAAGVPVVSGMALGIDGAAHRGALEAKGRSVAILGRGPDRAYPARHARLMADLLVDGAVWSEYAPGVGPRKHHFPERNRLIAGMVGAVVVVEAAERSGALITARLGLEAGVDVWAVPGRIDTPTAAGVHALLRDGARPVCSVEEVVGAYASPQRGTGPAEPVGVSPVAVAVWTRLSDGAADLDALAGRWVSGFPGPGPVLAALAELEVGGWITRGPDASWVRRAA
jgi:DNA processing protein